MDRERRLRERMQRLGIREEDIAERFVRAQGPGGQKVNKTSSCVYLKHLPTGIEVKCQLGRSQAQNRAEARGLLVQKLELRQRSREREQRMQEEKLRRQKRRRSAGAKARMLDEKKKRARKKEFRQTVREF